MKVNFEIYFKSNLMVCTDSIQLKIGGMNCGIRSFHSPYCRFNSCRRPNLHNGALIFVYVRV